MTPVVEQSVRESITVKAGPERAFRVFTDGIDTWWPRSHHIGGSPMTKAVLEGRVGGRCYSEQQDGTPCDWGRVLDWEPPRRFVMAWMITPGWKYEPDVAKSSEIEVVFTPQSDGSTRVDLEHRHFERHGDGWQQMKEQVGGPMGWGEVLRLFAEKAG